MALDDLLALFQDEARSLPMHRLSELSDLDSAEMARVRAAWPGIPRVRRQALVAALGRLADEHIEFTFERINRLAMTDPDPEVRRQAICNLWECENPDLVPPLLQALTADPEEAVRGAAASALGAFVLLGEVEAIPSTVLHPIEEGLLRAAQADPSGAVRRASIESLGYSSRPEVPPLIEAAYASAEEASKRSALLAMGRSADKPWAPQVLAELSSPSPVLRLEAVRAAGELELQETVPALIDLLEDVDDSVRRAAIWSLGQLGGKEANEALCSLLEASDDKSEIELLEDALENLAFVDGTRDFLMFDFDQPDSDD
ncbi:MAG: HEAT repeat domain-containing protein [Chloroflexota bacterium]